MYWLSIAHLAQLEAKTSQPAQNLHPVSWRQFLQWWRLVIYVVCGSIYLKCCCVSVFMYHYQVKFLQCLVSSFRCVNIFPTGLLSVGPCWCMQARDTYGDHVPVYMLAGHPNLVGKPHRTLIGPLEIGSAAVTVKTVANGVCVFMVLVNGGLHFLTLPLFWIYCVVRPHTHTHTHAHTHTNKQLLYVEHYCVQYSI